VSNCAPPRTIRCPDCGGYRDVSARHARRITLGEVAPTCQPCRQPVQIRITEEHRLFWLRWAGAIIPAGMTAAEYVAAYGLPDRFQVLCFELRVTRRRARLVA
jgi:hypothetical protein